MDLLKEGLELGIVRETNRIKQLPINGQPKEMKVYRIKTSHLFFNDKNDRIATFINKYKVTNNVTHFDKTDIEKYNEILHDFIVKSNKQAIEKTKRNIELVGQMQEAVVLRDGRIIDGNRRFTCLRELQKHNIKYEYIDAVILEQSIENDEREIKILELVLQQGEDQKVDYDPIERLVGIYNDITKNKLLTIEDYARSINVKISELKKDVEVADLMVDFLKFCGEEEKFYLARELKLDGPIREVYRAIKGIDDDITRNKKKNCYFSILISKLLSKNPGDITRYQRDVDKVLLGKFSDNFIEDNKEHLQTIYSICKSQKDFTEKTHLIQNSNHSSKIHESIELYKNKINSDLSKNEPLSLLIKAYDNIKAIDDKIFVKFNLDQCHQVLSGISKIENLCLKLKEKLNV